MYNIKKSCNTTQMYTQMQSAWEQHVWWTRSLIVSIANSLSDKDAVTTRLLKNPADIAMVYAEFYGKDVGKIVEDLITEHLLIGGKIIQAAKDGKTDEVEALQIEWYKNGDLITKTLAAINPSYNEIELKKMFYDHLRLTTEETVQYIGGENAKSIETFDEIEREALVMGNMLIDGIIKQHCL